MLSHSNCNVYPVLSLTLSHQLWVFPPVPVSSASLKLNLPFSLQLCLSFSIKILKECSRWPSRGTSTHLPLREQQNCNYFLNSHWQVDAETHQKKIPPVQRQRRSHSKTVGEAQSHQIPYLPGEWPTDWRTMPKQVLALLWRFWNPYQASQPGDLTKGQGIPWQSGLEGQGDLIIGLPEDWGKERLQGTTKNFACTKTQRRGAVTPQETGQKLPASVGGCVLENMGGVAPNHAGKSQWPKLCICLPTENIHYIRAIVDELAIFFQVFRACSFSVKLLIYIYIRCVYIWFIR